MLSTSANTEENIFFSQKHQKQCYLSKLALRLECKSETKQTVVVGSTCILKLKVDSNVIFGELN